jgi:hypothetical protein
MSKIKKCNLHLVDICVRDKEHFYKLVSTCNRLFGHGKWRTQSNTVYKLELGVGNLNRKWYIPDETATPFLKML